MKLSILTHLFKLIFTNIYEYNNEIHDEVIRYIHTISFIDDASGD